MCNDVSSFISDVSDLCLFFFLCQPSQLFINFIDRLKEPGFRFNISFLLLTLDLFLKNKFIYLFIFGCVGSSLLCAGFLQLRRVGATLSLWCTGFSLWWLLLLRSTGSRCAGFSSCGTRARQLWLAGSRVQAQQLWHMGLVAPQHVGSSWTRTRTRVPCTGRQILNTAPPGKPLLWI